MRAILICPHENLRMKFELAIAEHRGLSLSKVLTEYPAGDVLRRVTRAWAPQVVFIGLQESDACEEVCRQFENEFPWIQRMGLHLSQDPSTFKLALRLRMHEALVAPFNREEIGDVLASTLSFLAANPSLVPPANRMFAFVPAKPGVGASTIAANTIWAFSRIQKSQVLLADFDLSSGIAGFLFKAEHEHNVIDALSRSHQLDDEGWQKLVKKLGLIDLLPSGAPCLAESITGSQVHRLIEFIRRNYDVSAADVSDTLDDVSLAVMRDADRIILVTSAELPAVRMAKLKTILFQKLDLANKVQLVVNRTRKGNSLSLAEIEEIVGLPIFASFPCDYADVTKSIQNGCCSQALSASAESFAGKLLDKKPKPEKRARFLERFAIMPLRYTFR
jgi:pilus assembly protein CpaE